MKETIYHGSAEIIERPKYHGGKRYNDYGYGFYCTKERSLACEWAVTPDHDGFVNHYEIDTDDLRIVDINAHGVLSWLSVLLQNRTFNTISPLALEAKDYLIKHFNIDLRGADIVIGYRADDSYFSFAQDFISGAISVRQLGEAMRLGKLGEQFVLRSRRAHERVRFVNADRVARAQYLSVREARERTARQTYYQSTKSGRRKGDIYITQILDEEMKHDDTRLQ